jgi:hypothetical protein
MLPDWSLFYCAVLANTRPIIAAVAAIPTVALIAVIVRPSREYPSSAAPILRAGRSGTSVAIPTEAARIRRALRSGLLLQRPRLWLRQSRRLYHHLAIAPMMLR